MADEDQLLEDLLKVLSQPEVEWRRHTITLKDSSYITKIKDRYDVTISEHSVGFLNIKPASYSMAVSDDHGIIKYYVGEDLPSCLGGD